jgi:hypothetical protein
MISTNAVSRHATQQYHRKEVSLDKSPDTECAFYIHIGHLRHELRVVTILASHSFVNHN